MAKPWHAGGKGIKIPAIKARTRLLQTPNSKLTQFDRSRKMTEQTFILSCQDTILLSQCKHSVFNQLHCTSLIGSVE